MGAWARYGAIHGSSLAFHASGSVMTPRKVRRVPPFRRAAAEWTIEALVTSAAARE